ncbi:hypothetical protein L798_05896 [Zootermopsis nevadensis]|uniref:Uncharacterized protein n=1 Tax=Zootermopsis nevadensis TaxID=136037 RepID=A0A067RHK2_ZOONE|nr:hypothetical protein L798_05896 [Zootermopsis nevadensis]
MYLITVNGGRRKKSFYSDTCPKKPGLHISCFAIHHIVKEYHRDLGYNLEVHGLKKKKCSCSNREHPNDGGSSGL